ncbi:hypothetical protein [Bacillus sp. XF8]|nr:hypothetical protein [Bacillus sp. XF8]
MGVIWNILVFAWSKGEVVSALIERRIAVVTMTLSEVERQYKVEK